MSRMLVEKFRGAPPSFLYGSPSVESILRPEIKYVIQSALFRQEKRKEGETIAQSVTRPRKLAILCDFPEESIDGFIQEQGIDNRFLHEIANEASRRKRFKGLT